MKASSIRPNGLRHQTTNTRLIINATLIAAGLILSGGCANQTPYGPYQGYPYPVPGQYPYGQPIAPSPAVAGQPGMVGVPTGAPVGAPYPAAAPGYAPPGYPAAQQGAPLLGR